jgi:ATP-binding protein involved in chromosome partitioning
MTVSVTDAVREALKAVSYPGAAKDIVATGLLRGVLAAGSEVTVQLALPTMVVQPAVREAFLAEVTAAAAQVPGVASVRLDTTVRVASMPPVADKNRMPGVKNVIAVASGKGGVGKSTVATNLALALKRWGARVGLMDADVFGPSVPTMLGQASQPAGGTPEKRIAPAVYHGIPVMSVAFFIDKADAVVWRGPMVHKLLTQFLEDVDWGELDYLVIDFPPGTGDVQLSMAQLAPLGGAVMVTTPQEVAVIDVVKGISMFKKMEVPILGVVENMSYYVCPGCGHHDEIFARGGGKKLAEQVGAPFLGEIPLDSKVRFGGDSGVPVVVGAPDSEHARIFMNLATDVAAGLLARVLSGPRRIPSLVAIR